MDTNKSGRKLSNIIIIIIITAVITTALIFILISVMKKSVNSSVYAERKELLGRLTQSSANIIEDNIQYDQFITDIISDNAYYNIPNYENIDSYFYSVKDRPGYKDFTIFFVDDAGKYYSSDGMSGKIVDSTYFTSSSKDNLSYIGSLPHFGVDSSFFIFRNRFSNPVSISTPYGISNLLYCGVIFDIDELNEIVSSGFAGENNSFIYDTSSGVMLYKKFGIDLLIDGYNIYPKFSQAKINYGESPEELVKACKGGESIVTSLNIKDSEYYFCSSPIRGTDWSVAFIIQSSYMDEVSGNSFGKIILYISIIAMVLGAAIIFVIVFLYRSMQTSRSLKEKTLLNEQLESATQAKSAFLSNMSHDIRTPINGIMGMTTIAKGVSGNPEKTVDCLNKIEGASIHLLTLVNDVLDMSRIEQGRTEISKNPIDIRTICENCCSIIKGQMAGRRLELITEIKCDHPHLMGDDLHLRQIFINILGNAVKFTNDDGKIWFRCIEKESTETTATIAFEIEDTGIGMKPEFLEKIFDTFTQSEEGARSKYKGSGLGMAIAKQLTELMGGTIEVESELNKGSIFTVTVPFEINASAPEDIEIKQINADITGVKILLAEDNELNMEIAVELFEAAGATVFPVTNGKQALDAFTNNEPGTYDIILMDVMMPEMTGLEATKTIRHMSREDAQTIPIIAMTANAFESDIKATREAGMNAHLTKPININEVIKTIAYHTKK